MRPAVLLLLVGLVLSGIVIGLTRPLENGDVKAGRGTVDTLLATVDTLIAPSHIAETDTLSLQLRGTVGPNGCYSFHRIDAQRTRGQIVLHPRVQHTRQDACTMAFVRLNEVYRAAPPFSSDTLTVLVRQASASPITRRIVVGTAGGDAK